MKVYQFTIVVHTDEIEDENIYNCEAWIEDAINKNLTIEGEYAKIIHMKEIKQDTKE